MKTITIINWVAIVGYGLFVFFFSSESKQGDAAGQGMVSGFTVFATLVLGALIVLNLLPYRFPKIAVLVLLMVPVIVVLFNNISSYFELKKQRQYAAEQKNGSAYFMDVDRQQIAAAISAGDAAQLKTLLQKPQPLINAYGEQSMTLLDFAAITTAKSEHPQQLMPCLELLLEHGATIQGPDTLHIPTQFQIAETGSTALLKWFLDKGADPNVRPHNGNPILFKVLGPNKEQVEKTQLLLDRGADPNASAGTREYFIKPFASPLMVAAQSEWWPICNLLLEHGAEPDYRTPEGESLKTILDKLEKIYADRASIPADYPVFKKHLETKSAKKF